MPKKGTNLGQISTIGGKFDSFTKYESVELYFISNGKKAKNKIYKNYDKWLKRERIWVKFL